MKGRSRLLLMVLTALALAGCAGTFATSPKGMDALNEGNPEVCG